MVAILILRRGLVGRERVNGITLSSLHRSILLSYTSQRWSDHTRTEHHIFNNHQFITLAAQGKCALVNGIPTSHGASSHNPAWEHCFLACSGINFATISTGIPFSSLGLKLKRGGRNRPFGRRVLASRSSSKKG